MQVHIAFWNVQPVDISDSGGRAIIPNKPQLL